MRKSMILLAALAVSGCSTWGAMTENEKQTAIWVAGFVATAAVISNNNGDSTTIVTNECQKPGNQVCK